MSPPFSDAELDLIEVRLRHVARESDDPRLQDDDVWGLFPNGQFRACARHLVLELLRATRTARAERDELRGGPRR